MKIIIQSQHKLSISIHLVLQHYRSRLGGHNNNIGGVFPAHRHHNKCLVSPCQLKRGYLTKSPMRATKQHAWIVVIAP